MKNQLKQFKLKNEYFCSVQDIKYAILHDLSGKIILQGNSVGVKDHPEFTKLRNKLNKLGYISIQALYWNGDTVLKPFKLNQLSFEKGDQFSCADALGIKMNSLK